MEHLVVVALVVFSSIVVFRPAVKALRKEQRPAPSGGPACGGSCAGCSCTFTKSTAVKVTAGLGLLLVGTAPPALALDTTEPFDLGVSNAEVYLGYGGLGVGPADRELSSEMVLGYGLTPGFSAYLATCTAVAEQNLRGGTDLCLGLFGTAVDTDHFDLDLMLDLEASGEGMNALGLAPGIELNYDRDPDMASWGLFLRTGVAAYGQDAELETADVRRVVDLGVHPGAYYRLNERHELLVEFDVALGLGRDRDPADDTRGVAFGLNSMITPEIELITQLHRGLPQDGEDGAWDLNVGFVATLPGR